MTDQQQLHAIVHGHVQGVSFRYSAAVKALELGLTGWVRNLPDRTVETTAEGPHEVLQLYLDWLRRGPQGAHVTQVDFDWLPATGTFRSFDITG